MKTIVNVFVKYVFVKIKKFDFLTKCYFNYGVHGKCQIDVGFWLSIYIVHHLLRPTFYKELNCWLRNGGRNDFIVDMLQRQKVWWCWSSLGVATLPRYLNRSPEVALTHGRRPLDVARLWRFWKIVYTVLSVDVDQTTGAVPRYLQTDAAALHRSTHPWGRSAQCVERSRDGRTIELCTFEGRSSEGRWSFDAFGRRWSKDADRSTLIEGRWSKDADRRTLIDCSIPPPQLLTYIIMWAAYRMSVNESCLSMIFKLLNVSRFVVTS